MAAVMGTQRATMHALERRSGVAMQFITGTGTLRLMGETAKVIFTFDGATNISIQILAAKSMVLAIVNGYRHPLCKFTHVMDILRPLKIFLFCFLLQNFILKHC
jgi:hypothetical protein